jgi:peroxiredoxin Q/BCP
VRQVPYKAPDFSLSSDDGSIFKLSEARGKWVVLYFYPKDQTPGCTIEACSLRDSNKELSDLGAEVIGVSCDDSNSHNKFRAKHSLDFKLLSDPDHAVMDLYGAWGKKQFGQEGVLRKTFIISPDGEIVKVYGRVTPLGHGEKVVSDLKQLQNS